jgi:hypothetical protein
MSGGAGYVLSSTAFDKLASKFEDSKHLNLMMTSYHNVAEDAMMGWIMAEMGAYFVHAVGTQGVPYFLPLSLKTLSSGILTRWASQFATICLNRTFF